MLEKSFILGRRVAPKLGGRGVTLPKIVREGASTGQHPTNWVKGLGPFALSNLQSAELVSSLPTITTSHPTHHAGSQNSLY